METRYLENFLLVVETGSMAEAARQLNITAAAVAQQIHILEREFNTSLLSRAGRTVVPTPAGHRLAQSAPQLLRELANAHHHVIREGAGGELVVGTIKTALPVFGMHVFNPYLGAGAWRMDKLAVPDVNTDVAEGAPHCVEKYQITGLQFFSVNQLRGRCLLIGAARQHQTDGLAINGTHQTAAIKARFSTVSTAAIWHAQKPHGSHDQIRGAIDHAVAHGIQLEQQGFLGADGELGSIRVGGGCGLRHLRQRKDKYT